MQELGFKVVGIDASPKMVEQAKIFAPSCEFGVMDIRHLTFEKESFDGIICFATLIHLNDDDCIKALNSFFEILKPNGVLLVNVKELFNGEQKKIFDIEPFNPKFKTYFNRYTKEFIKQHLTQKLKMEFIKEYNNGLFNPDAFANGPIKKNSNQVSIIAKKI